MWSTFFPSGIFPKKKNPELEKRINVLNGSHLTVNKYSSPTLAVLQNDKSKVKRLSSVYEANISAFNETHHQSFALRKAMSEKCPLNEKTGNDNIKGQRSLWDLSYFGALKEYKQKFKASKKPSVSDLIQSLVDLDAKFIAKMEFLEDKYVKEFENFPGIQPQSDTFSSQRIFPIEGIYKFQKEEFHPMLVRSHGGVTSLARGISALCECSFSCYLIYAMDEKDSDLCRCVYYKFFMETVMDKVGIAWDFSPIQQLESYHGILKEILTIMTESKAPAEEIIEMRLAEADWSNLLSKVYAMQALQ